MAKTFKGWTRTVGEASMDKYFTTWSREGFPVITDYCDGTTKGWCDPNDRYQVQVENVPGHPYERSIYRSFKRLSDAILYAETGKYRWEV